VAILDPLEIELTRKVYQSKVGFTIDTE
jgi:hypothetical protein